MTGAADLLESWKAELANSRRRSPHTVRAYLACANRILTARNLGDRMQAPVSVVLGDATVHWSE